MILLLDNFDSFTYNIYQMVGQFHPDLEVYRNNVLSIDEIAALSPSHIILSPGPGYPSAAGIMPAVIRHFVGQIPLIGIVSPPGDWRGVRRPHRPCARAGPWQALHHRAGPQLPLICRPARPHRSRPLPFADGRSPHPAGLPESYS